MSDDPWGWAIRRAIIGVIAADFRANPKAQAALERLGLERPLSPLEQAVIDDLQAEQPSNPCCFELVPSRSYEITTNQPIVIDGLGFPPGMYKYRRADGEDTNDEA